MNSLYASPLRVYLLLGTLAFAGIFAGLQLPVSLFPTSSKPKVGAYIPYGNLTVSEFIIQYGARLENQLHAISTEVVEVDKTQVNYWEDGARFNIEFKFGTPAKSALKEVETVVNSFASQLPDEVKTRTAVYPMSTNSGFFSVSFWSETRSLEELYRLIEPVIIPQVAKLRDAGRPGLWNPSQKEIRVELDSDRMAAFQLMPRDIEASVRSALEAFSGGAVTVGTRHLPVQIPRMFNEIEDLERILIPSPGKKTIRLTDVARIDYDLQTLNTSIFKAGGTPNLILWCEPKPGGNVNRMSTEINEILKNTMTTLPKDVQYRVLVDPSEFIRSAVKNVLHEVAIGAFLAVLILFIFIGSLKNTITAAIEIPLSMVMAFILMKLSGMSINLISLGGLALSAGMNVDASVVVMENIFRHFEKVKGRLNAEERLKILVRAVNEVKFPVIASTVASLVVFVPLAFTSDLSYAILGDLAKAVVFSHGFSAVVALVLVPTVRLQLMKHGGEKTGHSVFEKHIQKIEGTYVKWLDRFLHRKNVQKWTFGGLAALLVALGLAVIPTLPKEVVGKPDTDWVDIFVNTEGNTLLGQMEETTSELEARVLKKFGSKIETTFIQVHQPNSAAMMLRLKHKKDMGPVVKDLESFLVNTSTLKFHITPWNPAEFSIPDPPPLRLVVRGGDTAARSHVARDIYQILEEKQVFPRLWTDPAVARSENIVLRPYPAIWSNLRGEGVSLVPSDLADLIRVRTTGRKIGDVLFEGVKRDVFLKYAGDSNLTPEDVGAIPIGLNGKIVPLRALSRVDVEESVPSVYQEDQREMVVISGRGNDADSSVLNQQRIQKATHLVDQWKADPKNAYGSPGAPVVLFEDGKKEITDALNQLVTAVIFSIALMFLILLLQFGDLVDALLVMVAIPLGFIGVLISLFVFRSTLSLNSMLGVILLNGIAVANSIILVDFLKKRVNDGLTPLHAALDAARARLRPILITSMTTILGMLPIALGLGEGGRILQPLGIAVSGGLWVSMGLTLFVVPALQVRYLNRKGIRSSKA